MDRTVGTSLLGESDDRVEDEDGDDDGGVCVLPQQDGDDRCDQQDQDERALELAQEQDGIADGRLGLEAVLPVLVEALGCRLLVEAACAAPELAQDIGGVERMPGVAG